MPHAADNNVGRRKGPEVQRADESLDALPGPIRINHAIIGHGPLVVRGVASLGLAGQRSTLGDAEHPLEEAGKPNERARAATEGISSGVGCVATRTSCPRATSVRSAR
jgi:hypothetical protein